MGMGIQVPINCLPMKYDIILIGGGLAGLSLAIELKKRKFSVLVIEKGSYPRQKVCGEYISMESHKQLHTLCPALVELNLPLINRFLLTTTSKHQFKTKLDLGGFGISRFALENLLFIEAKSLGVVFEMPNKAVKVNFDSDSSTYTVTTKFYIFYSRLVCNSTGRKSNFETLKKSNQYSDTNYIAVKYHVKINRDAGQIEIHNFPGGYCGISNVEEGMSCLCYIVNSKMLKSASNSIVDMEKRYLYQNKNLEKIFTTAEFITSEPITISGIKFISKKPYEDGVFYLGDAAGTIAPITGNGMSIAIRSAHNLALSFEKYFQDSITKKQLIREYSGFWIKQFYSRIQLSRYFQKLSEYPFLTNLTIKLFNLFPRVAAFVIKQTHGKPY